MTKDELIIDLSNQEMEKDKEAELERVKTCYMYASADDKRVIWAVLNKYVPMLSSEGLLK